MVIQLNENKKRNRLHNVPHCPRIITWFMTQFQFHFSFVSNSLATFVCLLFLNWNSIKISLIFDTFRNWAMRILCNAHRIVADYDNVFSACVSVFCQMQLTRCQWAALQSARSNTVNYKWKTTTIINDFIYYNPLRVRGRKQTGEKFTTRINWINFIYFETQYTRRNGRNCFWATNN